MSNNDNNFILIIKDTNKECPLKTNYITLILLSIIDIFSGMYFLIISFLKEKFDKVIYIIILNLSLIYLLFSILYLIKFRKYYKDRKEINNIIYKKKVRIYKKVTKFFMILGMLIGVLFFFSIFIYIFINDKFMPSCDEVESKKRLEDFLKLKICKENKCYNTKNNYINNDDKINNYNYLCNFRISNYFNNDDNTQVECVSLPKIKKNNINSSLTSLNIFYKERNSTVSKNIYSFLLSCDYDFNKYLYICNSNKELNNIKNFSIINNYNEIDTSYSNSENSENIKVEECITLINFLLYIFLNLIILFTIPIKIDIWYNEYKRFEIIKMQIHPNRLRVNNLNDNNDYINNSLDSNENNISISTENSSENSSQSNNLSRNESIENNNIFGVVIQN